MYSNIYYTWHDYLYIFGYFKFYYHLFILLTRKISIISRNSLKYFYYETVLNIILILIQITKGHTLHIILQVVVKSHQAFEYFLITCFISCGAI